MTANQQFCLRWNNHQSTLISVFDHLLESGTLVDCTLAAEGQFLKAHKIVLSACSPYLEAILSQHYEKHPIIILKDVTFHELKSMLDYMYRGEVNVTQEQLGTFLQVAESLQIKGLTDRGAISESRDYDRVRETEQSRDINRVDRSIAVSKRIEHKKPHSYSRSPLFGLSQNLMNVNSNQKGVKHCNPELNLSNSVFTRNGEGGSSLSNKRKCQFPPYFTQNEESSVLCKPVENNHHEGNYMIDNKMVESQSIPDIVGNVSSNMSINPETPLSTSNTNADAESDNIINHNLIKREVKSENYSKEVHNEDSVEDVAVDEEDEELDDADLTKPGPSNAPNSNVVGIPWHNAGEGNGEDMLLASQQESQDDMAPVLLTPDLYARLLGSALVTARSSMGLSFNCQRCGNTYARPHSLSRHIRFECGVDPKFECPICHKKSKHKHNLMLHMRTHQNR